MIARVNKTGKLITVRRVGDFTYRETTTDEKYCDSDLDFDFMDGCIAPLRLIYNILKEFFK